MLIGCDVDDCVANLSDVWIARYNKDWHDNLKINQITNWDVSRFVKPELGKNVFKYFEMPDLYDEIIPVKGAKEGVAELRKMGHRIVFVTSMTEGCAGRKYKWLKQYGFIDRIDDYVEMRDKSLLYADCLIDDNWSNISGFKFCGILYDRPWNKNINSTKIHFRIYNWTGIVKFIKGDK